MRMAVIITVGTLALSGCMHMGAKGEPDVTGGSAIIRAPDGTERGRARLTTVDGVMRLTVEGVDLQPGARGMHVHMVGRCDAPDFKSAGDHWNPDAKQHGRDNPMGAHRGDMPNLMIGTDGRGSISLDLPGSPSSLFDGDGASVVIHASADDYRTDPSGNSGARVACGILEAR